MVRMRNGEQAIRDSGPDKWMDQIAGNKRNGFGDWEDMDSLSVEGRRKY